MKQIDLTGQRFGMLTVLESAGKANKQSIWKCKCDCGQLSIKRVGNLRHGRTNSCGCLRKTTTAKLKVKHGMYGTPTYSSWSSMLTRCNNPRNHKYPDYGGRGIVVCKEWYDFPAFFSDMGTRPEGTTLGRIDNNGNYEPGNCEWQSDSVQARNKRNTALFEFRGLTAPLQAHCESVGMNYATVKSRIYLYGWPVEKALTTPSRTRNLQS